MVSKRPHEKKMNPEAKPSVQIEAVPAPERMPRAKKERRLTPELKQMVVDAGKALVLDAKVAQALREYARRKGWVLVTETREDGQVRAWRVA